jgi:hypothetical protein
LVAVTSGLANPPLFGKKYYYSCKLVARFLFLAMLQFMAPRERRQLLALEVDEQRGHDDRQHEQDCHGSVTLPLASPARLTNTARSVSIIT